MSAGQDVGRPTRRARPPAVKITLFAELRFWWPADTRLRLPDHMRMQSDSNRNLTGVQLVQKTASILRAVASSGDGLTIAESAQAVDLPRTTTQRLMEALVAEGMLICLPGSKRYRIGLEIQRFASASRLSVGRLLAPLLQGLANKLDETVAVSVLLESAAVYTDRFHGIAPIQAVVPIGVPMSLHSLASGKAMMASLDASLLGNIRRWQKQLTAVTERTIVSWEELDGELEKIRQAGYALDDRENSSGVSAVAFAMTGYQGEVFAISVAAPSARFAQEKPEIIRALLETKRNVQDFFQRIGG